MDLCRKWEHSGDILNFSHCQQTKTNNELILLTNVDRISKAHVAICAAELQSPEDD